ncbi:MAG: YncE family protein [Acidobacteriota bacterium]
MQRRNFLTALGAAAAAPAQTARLGTLFVGAWQKKIVVIDEATQKVTGEIELKIDVPRSLMFNEDRSKILVHSTKGCSFEIVDVATRKLERSFSLDTGGKNYRTSGLAISPDNKRLYSHVYVVDRKIDRFEVGKPQWAVVDLAGGKFEKFVELPKELQRIRGGGRGGGMRVSPDGKYIYLFRENVAIYSTEDFKEVDKIELSKPLFPGLERVTLGPGDDPHEPKGKVLGFFNSTDTVVHKTTFGFAEFDLTKRTFEFTPVGPSTSATLGLRLTPDRKTGYTVAFNGMGANRRCEFWIFDIASRRITKMQEFEGRSRFEFSLSSDGKTIYIYGAGNTVEMFDTATLRQVRDLDVNTDMTSNMLVLPG